MSTPAPDAERSRRHFVWTWLAVVAALALLVFPAVTLGLLNWYDDPGLRWIAEIRARKLHAAELAGKSGRILIAGGSSATFSIDAELLEAKLGRPAVNIASHGALRLHLLLEDARRAAHAGDTVLLHLEYSQYRGGEAMEDIERQYLWTYDAAQILRLPPAQAFAQVYGNPWSEYVQSWDTWNMRLRGELKHAEPQTWTHYSFVNLGPRGDYRGAMIGQEKIAPPKLAGLEVTASARQELREFFAWCRARKIEVTGVLPGVMQGSTDWAAAGATVRRFYEEEKVPLLGDPAALQRPRELLFDTAYHANEAGRRQRTEALVADLARLPGFSIRPAPPTPHNFAALSDWAAEFPRHVFVLATAGRVEPIADAPAPFRDFLRDPAQSHAAIVGTGPLSKIVVIEHGDERATVKQSRDKRWQYASRFPLDLRATAGAEATISVEREVVVTAHEHGVAIAVIDPELGIVVKRGVLAADGHFEARGAQP